MIDLTKHIIIRADMQLEFYNNFRAEKGHFSGKKSNEDEMKDQKKSLKPRQTRPISILKVVFFPARSLSDD